MEYTKNKLPDNIEQFFTNMREYLDTSLYFYGSVQRNDYIPGKSDIDVAIYSENVNETVVKLQHFLHIPASEFKRFVKQFKNSNRLIYGYKTMFHDEANNFFAEISIYKEKDKKEVLEDQRIKIDTPLYISWILLFIKILHYHFNIIEKKRYKKWKAKLLAYNTNFNINPFVIID